MRFLKVILFYGLLVFIGLCVVWSFPKRDKLVDYGAFVTSGRAADRGLNPYGVYDLTPRFKQGDVVGYAVNRNPPISVLIFQPISRFDPVVAFRVWYFSSLALYALVLLLLSLAYRAQASPLRIAWALSLAGIWSTVNLGQIYVPLALAAVGTWLCLRQRRYVPAGLLLGALVAIKPNFAVWPVLLLIAGYWTPAVVAFISAGVASALPLLVYGPEIYREWLAVASSHPWIGAPTNGSLFALADRIGIPPLGFVASAALLLGLAGWTWRRQFTASRVGGLALVGSLLASPVAWTGYTLVLLPLFFRRSWSPAMSAAAVLLLAPDTLVAMWSGMSAWHFAVFANLTSAALLLLLASTARARDTREEGVSGSPGSDGISGRVGIPAPIGPGPGVDAPGALIADS